jgi:hypothetical protein
MPKIGGQGFQSQSPVMAIPPTNNVFIKHMKIGTCVKWSSFGPLKRNSPKTNDESGIKCKKVYGHAAHGRYCPVISQVNNAPAYKMAPETPCKDTESLTH